MDHEERGEIQTSVEFLPNPTFWDFIHHLPEYEEETGRKEEERKDTNLRWCCFGTAHAPFRDNSRKIFLAPKPEQDKEETQRLFQKASSFDCHWDETRLRVKLEESGTEPAEPDLSSFVPD